MTEEEKKEFEEFLQWKAEKSKKQNTEDDSMKVSEETETRDNSIDKLITTDKISNDNGSQEDNGGHIGLIIVTTIISLVVLFIIVMGLSNKKTAQAEPIEVEDSIAVVGIDDESLTESVVDATEDSIKQAERISEVKKTIKITSAYLSSPNSASGVDAYFYYKNLSNKTIKYLIWEGYPINAVGDRVACDIRGYNDYRGKDTGPVKPGRKSGGCWECAWYNSTAKKLILTGIEIEYMDGSTFTIKDSEIEYVR